MHTAAMRMKLHVRLGLFVADDAGRDVWARFASEHYGTPFWKDIEGGDFILEHTYEPGVTARYPLDVIRDDLREFADAAARRPM